MSGKSLTGGPKVRVAGFCFPEIPPGGRADWEIGAPSARMTHTCLNLAGHETCKTLLQVKQSFVIHLKTLTPSRATTALRRPHSSAFSPDEFRYGTE